MLAFTGLVAAPNLAGASSPTPSTSIGFDISWPQCGGHFPAPPGFGVIGVNDGHSFSTNPCLASELQWAKGALTASPQFYSNVDNPGPANNPSWPINQQAPHLCSGADSEACSFDYGWNAAQGSLHGAVAAETQIGSPSPLAAAKGARWWLDVETGNAWESLRTNTGPTSASYANDQAVLSGELAYFKSVGVAFVGIYSNVPQFRAIMGATGSTFAATQGWMPGYATLTAAQAACASASFTGGRVAMIQYPLNGLDGDYVCPLLSTPISMPVSVATAVTFTQQLAVAGDAATVAYVQTTGAPYLTVSPTGLIATDGTLTAGTYTASGTTSDTNGDSGTFAFTLAVGTLTQNAHTSASVTVPASATFTNQLAVTGSSGPVTFVQTTGAPTMTVSPTGLIATSGTLALGSYVVRGTMSDASGDMGTFFFNLKVGTMTQSSPNSASTSTAAFATFTSQLAVTGSGGPVTFVQTTGAPYLTVSPTGLIATSGTVALGSYVVRGTMSDASGDTGTFFFNLRVSGAAPTPTLSVALPVAYRAVGHAVAGKTVAMRIAGAGFFGRPLVTSHNGTVALVTKDNGTMLSLKVTVKPRSRNGLFTFTIALADGRLCVVRYIQR